MLPRRCWVLVGEGGDSCSPGEQEPHTWGALTQAWDHAGPWGWAVLQAPLGSSQYSQEQPQQEQNFPESQFLHL